MAEDEEVLIEVEAVLAMYGDDCVILDSFPPHLHIHIKPRTADISSQQFVEAVIGIRAGPQYPSEPPRIDLIESKGLDGERQKQLITSIQDKACELPSCLMLVALCEEAVDKLSVMNHPDGDCPLCLHPLVPVDEQDEALPFMKLMSCFHCFHSECIVRWWNWIQKEKESNTSTSSSTTLQPIRDMGDQKDVHGVLEGKMGNCPVCRKVFHAKDFEHVIDLVGTQASQMNSEAEIKDEEKLLYSDSENFRRQKFDAILKLQQENSGLIEPKKDIVVLPGIYLAQRATPQLVTSQPATSPAQTVNKETIEHPGTEARPSMETNLHGSLNRRCPREPRNSGRRKHRVQNSRRPASQWVRRENNTAD